jgi:DNA-binding Lrp family transcriptional regulator
MKSLFVQIKCELTKSFEVAAYLVDNLPETAEVYSTSGTFDLLVKFELADEESFGEFVTSKLQRVPRRSRYLLSCCVQDSMVAEEAAGI